jgi:hypothetical protein
MKIQIKNRWYGTVIFECEAENIREACEKAVTQGQSLSTADLRDANLSAADLRAADLRDANLRAADLSAADLRDANLSAADLRAADLRDANLSAADLRDANLSAADLRAADLSAADLRDANLSAADLRAANLRDANLSAADLRAIKVDFFDVLLRASSNGEVPGLIAALKEGRVDGSTYTGTCACLVGTIANVKDCEYTQIPNLMPDSNRPAERFFLNIDEGDTPETNKCAKIAVEWAEEFQTLMAIAVKAHQ